MQKKYMWSSGTPPHHVTMKSKAHMWYLKSSRISYSPFLRNLFQMHAVEMLLRKHFLNNIMYSNAD